MSDRISNVSSNSNVHNNIIDNQDNKPVNNVGNKPEEMQNAKKSGSKLALALKITATILTAGLFGIGWGIYSLVKHARKSSNTAPQNKANTGVPDDNKIKDNNIIIEKGTKTQTSGKVTEGLPLSPLAEPFEYTVELDEESGRFPFISLSEGMLKKFEKKNPFEDLDLTAQRFNGYGNITDMVNDLMEKLGNDNTDKLLKKILGKDYNTITTLCEEQGYDPEVRFEMAIIYAIKKEAETNTDDPLFSNAGDELKINEITVKDLVNKFINTLSDALKENNITATIKLEITK